jgi:mannose-1-phosphate guanylyltransferase
MFSWRAADFLRELETCAPDHFRGLTTGADYASLPNEAVDYAVMERTRRLLLVPAEFGWVDVGSWSELHELLPNDEHGNTVHGEAALIDTRGSLISAPGKVVAAIGVEDLIVVDTEQALLVLPKSRAQDVKQIVALLKASGKTRYL